MTEHLKENNISYFKHWKRCMTCSLVLFIHGWIPSFMPDYVSKKLNDEKSLTSAVGHHDAIKKFGRFPHRNKILGRKNTKAETEYLKSPPTWGMTKAEAEDLEKKLGKS